MSLEAGMISRQLDDLDYQYDDINYFPEPDDLSESKGSEREYLLSQDFDKRVEARDLQMIKDGLEGKFDFDILNTDYFSVRTVYKFFVSDRLDNITDIIYKYTMSNLQSLFNNYKNEVNLKEDDNFINYQGEERYLKVIKKTLSFIVAEALNKDLTEYIDTSKQRRLYDVVELDENDTIYILLCSTVMGDDLHYINNLCEKVRIKMNKYIEENIKNNDE